MKFDVIETATLPLSIREKFHTRKVSVIDRGGEIILSPISEEVSGLRGAALGSEFSTEILLSNKLKDKELEK
jgi:hypothetical protein